MSRRRLLGFFEDEDDILAATRAVRGAGYEISDVYSPYAVHGLDKAMGLEPSKLPWVGAALGLAGAAAKVWFEIWTSEYDWPINVGGKPFNSLPAFIPVTFEVMVLFAGMSTVFAFFLVARLYPGRRAEPPDPAVSDHRFVMVIEENDAAFDADTVHRLLREFHVGRVEERVD